MGCRDADLQKLLTNRGRCDRRDCNIVVYLIAFHFPIE